MGGGAFLDLEKVLLTVTIPVQELMRGRGGVVQYWNDGVGEWRV